MVKQNNNKVQDEETTSQRLYNHLFEACNILRGPINQDEFKDYITPLLFFKRLSDVYDEETAVAMDKSGGDAEYANMDCNHRFVIPEGCHWNNVREQVTDVGQGIVNAMTSIERANPETLQGVFSSFDEASWTNKGKLDDARLRDLVDHMSRINVGNKNYSADVMGDSYEFLLKRFADESNSNAGEFYTPRAAVKLLIKILAPKPGETVYDPACGTGGMLIEAIHYMNDDKSSYGKIYGQEKNLSTSAIARMNLFLHGAEDFKVLQGDTLRSPMFMEYGEIKRFDCVIANPPFSLENWGAGMFASDVYGRNIYGCPTDSNGDYAWIQHMVKSMNRVTGRCAVVLPQGVLFRRQEKKMRIKMLEDDKLECVITLAKNIFYNTQLAPCILIFRDVKSEERKKKILMVDASSIYNAKRAQNILTDTPGGDVDTIFALYNEYADQEEVAKVVSDKDVIEKDYTLAVNRYIEKAQAPTADPAEVRATFEKVMSEVFEAEAELKKKLVDGGLLDE